MNMRRWWGPFVFVAACGGSSGGANGVDAVSEESATSGASCEDLARSAREEVSSVIESHRSCSTSADCVETALSATCFDSCSRSVAASGEADVKKAKASVDGAQCRQFLAQGCKLIPPPCAPPTPPTCESGVCK